MAWLPNCEGHSFGFGLLYGPAVQAGCGINAFQVVSKFEYFSHADLLSKKYFWLRNNQKLPVIGLDAKLSCRQDETAAR
jgi:hypothetical protein